MCVDFRIFNMQTKWDMHLLPCIKDLLDYLFTASYFLNIDLATGYHYVRITPEYQYFSAFMSRYGLFEWMVMPFRLTNAPLTF